MAESSQLDVIAQRLTEAACNPRRSGNGWVARCPAHDDRTPSLVVSAGAEHPVVLHCHAGCDTADVLDKLGLSWGDVSANGEPRSYGHHDSWPYVDADGEVVARKVRRGNAKPWQNPDGTWADGAGKTATLYRFPEVLAAVAHGADVWLVEGEKDADRTAAEGVTATTTPHGVLKPSLAEYLRGASVLIVADNDKPGFLRARKHAAALAGIAASVVLVRPAVETDKADVTDHLDAGYSLNDLLLLEDSDTPTSRDDKYAMVPLSVGARLACDGCVRAFCIVDGIQGPNGFPIPGRNQLAADYGKDPKWWTKHLGHLEAHGLLEVRRDGQKKNVYVVVNPLRPPRAGGKIPSASGGKIPSAGEGKSPPPRGTDSLGSPTPVGESGPYRAGSRRSRNRSEGEGSAADVVQGAFPGAEIVDPEGEVA